MVLWQVNETQCAFARACWARAAAEASACGFRCAQVQEQGELAIRIDENVDTTLTNVDSAQAQLLKYLNSISSNRWLVMKIFAVLLVFLVVFVVFIA